MPIKARAQAPRPRPRPPDLCAETLAFKHERACLGSPRAAADPATAIALRRKKNAAVSAAARHGRLGGQVQRLPRPAAHEFRDSEQGAAARERGMHDVVERGGDALGA